MTAAQCGTYAGYAVHSRRREAPCEACKAARTAYVREWRRTRRLLGLSVS